MAYHSNYSIDPQNTIGHPLASLNVMLRLGAGIDAAMSLLV